MYEEDLIYKRRRLILIISIILFIIIIALIIYFIFYKKTNNNIENNKEESFIQKLLPKSGERKEERKKTENVENNYLDDTENTEGFNNLETKQKTENENINKEENLIKVPYQNNIQRSKEEDNNTSFRKIDVINIDLSRDIEKNTNDNTVRFYDYDQNQFFKINKNGDLVPLSDKKFYKVQKTKWAPKSDEAILSYADGKSIYYNFDTDRQITLPDNWENFEFAPDGKNIAFVEDDVQADYRWLSIAKPDGSGKKEIRHLGINADKVEIQWSPDKQIVAKYPVIKNLSRSEIYFLGQNDENFPAIYIDGADARSIWSPKGNSLLASSYSPQSNFNPELEIIYFDPNTKEAIKKQKIHLSTWVDKCIYKDENTIYCAVPQRMIEGAGLEPDVMKYSIDDLYSIDLKTGETKKILDNKENYTITNLTIAEDGNLYFIDKNTGMLEKIYIK